MLFVSGEDDKFDVTTRHWQVHPGPPGLTQIGRMSVGQFCSTPLTAPVSGYGPVEYDDCSGGP
jgi:hypothetical protein